MTENTTTQKTVREQAQEAGNQAVDKVKELVSKGNIRQLVLRKKDGEKLLSVSLTVGVIVGGIAALTVPWLALLVAIGGYLAKVRIEVIREADDIIEQ